MSNPQLSHVGGVRNTTAITTKQLRLHKYAGHQETNYAPLIAAIDANRIGLEGDAMPSADTPRGLQVVSPVALPVGAFIGVVPG